MRNEIITKCLPDNIAATKESLIIDIVSEDKQETIALRRTIATEMDRNSDVMEYKVAASKESLTIAIMSEDVQEIKSLHRTIATEIDRNFNMMESESILEKAINLANDDSFDDHFMIPIETVTSDLIYLDDINEPSTSKGIRHVRADAQCGTDILGVCPNPSGASSLINVCEMGIKFGDSCPKIRSNKNFSDFGTLTEENSLRRDYLSFFKKQSLRIKDSDTNIFKNVECSTMTQDNGSNSDADIRLAKFISSERQTKTVPSELSICISDPLKSKLHCLSNFSNLTMSRNGSPVKNIGPKLSCCGVHVHSYRDRHVSEDVVFQGEWQRKRPKVVGKKRPYAQMISRKREVMIKKKIINSKEKMCLRKQEKRVNTSAEKPSVLSRNVLNVKEKQSTVTKGYIKKQSVPDSSTKKINVQTKNVTKVASKITTSMKMSKSQKSISATKNKSILKFNSLKECENKKNRSIEKCQFNCTKRNEILNTNTLNKSGDSGNLQLKKKPVPQFIGRKTMELKNDLLKYNNGNRTNTTYLVFCNEIESARSADSSAANPRRLRKVNGSKNNPSSQNSSPCSSPNSTSTIRVIPRIKNDSNRNNSPSSERNSSANICTEKTESMKIKKCIKNNKSPKWSNFSSASYENKENLPATSKKYEIHKKDQSKAINDKNKTIFMMQINPESSPARNSLGSKQSEVVAQPLNSSKIKLLNSKSTDSYQKGLSSLSFKNISSNNRCKSPVITNYDRHCNFEADCSISKINNAIRSSTPLLDTTGIVNIEDHQCTNSAVQNIRSNVRRSNSKINADIKQLIEERFSFIQRIEDDNNSDSETIILRRDNSESLNENSSPTLDERSSPISYQTIPTNDNTCNMSGKDFENVLLNYSFDSDLEDQGPKSILSKVNDTDLLSFKYVESTSRNIESSLIHNELDKTLVLRQSTETEIKSVHDIFERKDPDLLKNAAGGSLAVQVFSGFSMDEEPVVGDQSEYISLVDPATGSLALEVARQVTSEELFVSGRSSDTYESCNVDDDSFVPNWLFHVISQQQSAEIPEEQEEFPPAEAQDEVEPEYDVNGNVMDGGIWVAAGAGDGRGMHSDQSQDSSGRGSSVSSSDVSSGAQSEVMLINPSAFIGPVTNEVPMSGPTAAVFDESSEASFRTVENTETDNEPQYNRVCVRIRSNRAAGASDVDADVSSLETDAADSDI